jgi:hypothetical protein
MKIAPELEAELIALGVASGDISFGEIKDGALSILREGGEWIAIHEERGQLCLKRRFREYEALRTFALYTFSKERYHLIKK